MGNKNWWVMAVITALLVVACNSGGAATPAPGTPGAATPGAATPGAATPAPATEEPQATEAPEPTTAPEPAVPTLPTGYAELDTALDGTTYKGTTVSIQTQWIGGEGANFAAALADFSAATGITIQVDSIGSSHETVLRTRIEGGTPPDLAMLAQPTAVLAYGAGGKLVDAATVFGDGTPKMTEEHSATVGLITDDAGMIWGIPYKADVKSTVWYPIKSMEKFGYAVPTSWQEMLDLSQQILDDGNGKPWCAGMEAGTATGWQYTDWVEEVMLRTQTPETYNAWIAGDLKFDSPEVRAAFEMTDQILSEDFVLGGLQAVMNIPQTEPFDGAFPEDGTSDDWDNWTPECWFHKIPTWYGPDFFPDVRAGGPGTVSMYEIGEDIGIFYLPPINEEQGPAALGSADTLMVLAPAGGGDTRPEVKAVAQFLSTPQGLQRWIEAGSAISANNTTPQDWYAGFYKLDVASKIVNNASYVGFDASDLMPPEVGAGAFWTEAVAHVNDGKSLDEVLPAIDAAWSAQ
jgi:alpha-glucoside transport system substrate-binding protein